MRTLDALRTDVQTADDVVSGLRIQADEHDESLKGARAALEAIRAVVAELDVARATAEADLAHLATSCVDTVQATLDEVLAEVDELERAGDMTPDARVICAEENRRGDDEAHRRRRRLRRQAAARSRRAAGRSAPKRRLPRCAPRSIGSVR